MTAAGTFTRRVLEKEKRDMTTVAPEQTAIADATNFGKLDVAELESRLRTSRAGLTSDEARRRQDQYGLNEIREESVNPLYKLLTYFWGPIPWMIEIAAVLSLIVRHWVDFCIIGVLLLANAVVGFWEEYQAGNAIAALKKRLALRAHVKRDKKWTAIPARELVPGDLIRLRIGEIVPADAKLTGGDPLEVDQSALTGESLPVTRRTGDVVYSGSIVRRGETDAFVYATGTNTYFGKTAQLVEEGVSTSHFQKAVLKIGDFLILLAVALVGLILAVALFRGDPMMTTVQFALVLTVAAIPVALPTVLSVTMAVGAKLLSASQAIVSRLASIEELAGMDILCSDKTGTLTQNKLTLGTPYTVKGVSAEETIQAAALASRAEDDDPIDLAVLSGWKPEQTAAGPTIKHFVPFDPVNKRTEATVETRDGGVFRTTKGAPQVILKISANADQVRADVDKAIDDLAARGYRALGVARTDANDQWQFLGILPLHDPPRDDSKTTLEAAHDMGCRVKMVTGDQKPIAREIARELSMGSNILDAEVFAATSHHETGRLADAIEEADGFAQVYPEHKYHIVDVLQQRGHVVGMTGDGVNDAPALKKADVGIAVSGATDAARAAADIVLLSPGLSVIINAIQESRRIFQRMRNYALYRIAETIRVLLFMTLSILIFNFYPVTAVMIVLLALLNDGAILSIAFDRVNYSNRPETWNMREILGLATILGVVGVAASFGLFYLGERVFGLDRAMIQSLMYLKLSVAGHLTVFVARTRRPFWSIPPAPILLWAVVGTQLIATLIAVYGIGLMTPVGWSWAAAIWGYCLAWFVVADAIKVMTYRVFEDPGGGFLLACGKY
jgi:H+-transporting ATPase